MSTLSNLLPLQWWTAKAFVSLSHYITFLNSSLVSPYFGNHRECSVRLHGSIACVSLRCCGHHKGQDVRMIALLYNWPVSTGCIPLKLWIRAQTTSSFYNSNFQVYSNHGMIALAMMYELGLTTIVYLLLLHYYSPKVYRVTLWWYRHDMLGYPLLW